MLACEVLERRENPSVVLDSGLLTVTGTPGGDVVAVNPGPAAGQLSVVVNQDSYTFSTSDVSQFINVFGLNGSDLISNNTAVPCQMFGMGGDDVLMGSAANDTLTGGNGRDTYYDLLGTNVINAQDDAKADRVFTNASSLKFTDRRDLVVTFFGQGRTPGSGDLEVGEDGVLYITPVNAARTSTRVYRQGRFLTVDTDWGGGPERVQFDYASVKAVAFFGGTGNDSFRNDTNIATAAYGSAGNDVVVGGFGYNLLKGSGGSDVLFGRGTENDVSSNGGGDTIVTQGQADIIRALATDNVVALGRTTRYAF